MVLKVVRGKIFKTWKLSRCRIDGGSILELRRDRVASNVFAVTMIVGVKASPRSGAPVGLSKIEDYLVDNLYVLMLSELKDAVNKKRTGCGTQFQVGNLAVVFLQLNLGGQRVVVSSVGWSAVAMSGKSPAFSQRTCPVSCQGTGHKRRLDEELGKLRNQDDSE